jgi:hypothetical protein
VNCRWPVQVDAPTPDSEGLHRPQIPDTTQRRLEGFCLNTPLTLSQAAAAEVRAVVPSTAGCCSGYAWFVCTHYQYLCLLLSPHNLSVLCRPLPLVRTCTRTHSSRMSYSSMQQRHVVLKQQQPRHSSGTGWQTSAICHAAPCTRRSKALVEKNLHLILTQGLRTAACNGQRPSSSSSSRQAHGSNAGDNRRSPFFQVRL